MAGGLAATWAAKLARKKRLEEQRKRNAEATAEAEARRQAMHERAPAAGVEAKARRGTHADKLRRYHLEDKIEPDADASDGAQDAAEAGAAPPDPEPADVDEGAPDASEATESGPVDTPEPSDPLEGVRFASGVAEREARGAGLTAENFDGLIASGSTGYTAADVRLILEG